MATRPKQTDERRQWKRFRQEQLALTNELGLPLLISQDHSAFEHFLMHGYHPNDATGFSADSLPAGKRVLLLSLLDAYFAAGFLDPGLGLLSLDERRTLAASHPAVLPL